MDTFHQCHNAPAPMDADYHYNHHQHPHQYEYQQHQYQHQQHYNNHEECSSAFDIEPTPLSEVIHSQHLVHQQQIQQELLWKHHRLARNAEINEIIANHNRSLKRRREDKPKLAFFPNVWIHENPKYIEEIPDLWYSKDDLAVFKAERKQIIRALKKVNFDLNMIDQTVYQLRGLEAYLSIRYNKLMLKKRSEAIKGVIGEQSRQRSLGIHDVEAIRNASCEATRWAGERGLESAREDAKYTGNHDPITCPLSTWKPMDVDTPSLCSSASGSTATTVSTVSSVGSACHTVVRSNRVPF